MYTRMADTQGEKERGREREKIYIYVHERVVRVTGRRGGGGKEIQRIQACCALA